MKKKKERTPEQKATRFKFAVGFVAFLIAFFLVAQLFNGKKEVNESTYEQASEMDRQLDSLISAVYADSLTVTWKGEFESVPFDDDLIPEIIAYKKESMRYEILEMTSQLDTPEQAQQKLADAAKALAELERKADEARERYSGKTFCTARGIHLQSRSGETYAGFQTCSEETHTSIIEGLVKITE